MVKTAVTERMDRGESQDSEVYKALMESQGSKDDKDPLDYRDPLAKQRREMLVLMDALDVLELMAVMEPLDSPAPLDLLDHLDRQVG